MGARRLASLLLAGVVALAGCATTRTTTQQAGPQPTEQTAPAQTATTDTTPTTTSTQPDVPNDPRALTRQGLKTCGGIPVDELRQRYSAPSSDPVDVADAYARQYPTYARVPLAEGCYQGITGASISSAGGGATSAQGSGGVGGTGGTGP